MQIHKCTKALASRDGVWLFHDTHPMSKFTISPNILGRYPQGLLPLSFGTKHRILSMEAEFPSLDRFSLSSYLIPHYGVRFFASSLETKQTNLNPHNTSVFTHYTKVVKIHTTHATNDIAIPITPHRGTTSAFHTSPSLATILNPSNSIIFFSHQLVPNELKAARRRRKTSTSFFFLLIYYLSYFYLI